MEEGREQGQCEGDSWQEEERWKKEESRGNVRETAGKKKKEGREQGQCEGDSR